MANSSGATARAFQFLPSTLFILLATASIGIPVAIGWGGHDGGVPALLAYVLFPLSTILALVLSIVFFRRGRSLQGWIELSASGLLLALLLRIYV
jgi:hypothetical protein